MYAELVINIEAALEGTFHYHVPKDLLPKLEIGQLVEVEFGRRLAQGVILAFDDTAPVEDTKPIINLIDPQPIVRSWQIELARWMSGQYLAPLNGCLRLMLPPGLTRWADITLEIDPFWDGTGRLTEVQEQLLVLLRQRGDLRGRQLSRAMPKGTAWRPAANQLVKRGILRKASVLDPPRIRPKMVRTAELIAGPEGMREAAMQLGRASKGADILFYLLTSEDPLPEKTTVLEATAFQEKHLIELVHNGAVKLYPAGTIIVPGQTNQSAGNGDPLPDRFTEILNRLPMSLEALGDEAEIADLLQLDLIEMLEQPATLSLALPDPEALALIFQLRRAETYHKVLSYLLSEASPVPLSELYEATGANLSHLRKLAVLELIQLGEQHVWRDPLADRDFVPSQAPKLTADQDRVWETIQADMIASWDPDSQPTGTDKPLSENISAEKPYLLHGVTGSGKTEIYMHAVDHALKRGQRAIVLVPEIALTPQTVRRFAARFPGQVALLHSRLSDGERYDTWRRARQGEFDIIVGPRSALFTPFENLGIIVLDEEHDHSYKQTPPVPAPYYHARDVAIQLGAILGATVILGSATPDLVTYHRARAGLYHLLELPKRIMGHRRRISGQANRMQRESIYRQAAGDPEDALTIPLPPIQVVDLRQELRAGNRSIFSRLLEKEIGQTLERGEQAILFLNRRGTATFVMCRDCGLVLKCPRCDMPLTYHRPGLLLECHYCGRKEPQHHNCPRCGSDRIKYFGLGTEEVERLVGQKWPQARIVRWDRDTTAGKDTHEALLTSFINQEADILVGTQMIAKGLDLPLVTLVGVISADVTLGLPDYRIGERTFQILAQVAGRAGRGLMGGRVVIQTYQPHHYAIEAAAEHDFTSFYLEEIRFRTQHGLPPFRRLAKLVIADPVDNRAEREARQLFKALQLHARDMALGATELLGPVPPFFNRLGGRYRWQIIIRSPNPNRLLQDFPIPTNWILDIDPVSTL